MRLIPMRVGVAVGLAAVGLALFGCTGAADDAQTLTLSPGAIPLVPQDLSGFDVFVMASAENNPLFADVYGLTFEPVTATRITTDKRISSLDANAEHIVVAAAEGGNPDRLAYVGADGALRPIPGLGRPQAFDPNLRDDGAILFAAREGTGSRFIAFDPAGRRRSVLFRSKRYVGAVTLGPDGRLALGTYRERDPDTLMVRERTGTERTFTIDKDTATSQWGRRWIAVDLQAADSRFGEEPIGLLLVDPDTGERKRVPGWQPVAWNPSGTKLLARRTGAPTTSALALINPAEPDKPESLGTVEDLAIYSGAWVERG